MSALRLIEIQRARDHVAVTCGLDDLRFHFAVWYQDVDLDALARDYGDGLLDRLAFHIAMFQINAVTSLRPDVIELGAYAQFATARFRELWRTVFRKVWAQWRWEPHRSLRLVEAPGRESAAEVRHKSALLKPVDVCTL